MEAQSMPEKHSFSPLSLFLRPKSLLTLSHNITETLLSGGRVPNESLLSETIDYSRLKIQDLNEKMAILSANFASIMTLESDGARLQKLKNHQRSIDLALKQLDDEAKEFIAQMKRMEVEKNRIEKEMNEQRGLAEMYKQEVVNLEKEVQEQKNRSTELEMEKDIYEKSIETLKLQKKTRDEMILGLRNERDEAKHQLEEMQSGSISNTHKMTTVSMLSTSSATIDIGLDQKIPLPDGSKDEDLKNVLNAPDLHEVHEKPSKSPGKLFRVLRRKSKTGKGSKGSSVTASPEK